MPGNDFLRDQLRRERERADREGRRADHQRRRGNWSYGIMVVAVIGIIVTGYLWFKADNQANELNRDLAESQKSSSQRFEDQRAGYERQLAREKRINDVYSERITRLWSLNAQLLGSLNWERDKAGELAAENIHIWRRNRDLQEDKQRLRENWTSELGIEQ